MDSPVLVKSADGTLDDEEDPFLPPSLEELATHIPDMVLYRSHKAPVPQMTHCYGVMMFLDISGFTALCERYCSDAKSKHDGTDQLTTTLNRYLSQIVQAILEAEGDVLKFAGDAVLAFWECSRFAATSMLNHVLQQSLEMQNNFDNYTTPDGVVLRMKIGLSIGTADVHFIGDKDYKTLDITGECVDDANTAQSVTSPGTVVVSKVVWEMCDKEKCFAKFVGKGCAMVSKMLSGSCEKATKLPELIASDVKKPTWDSVIQAVATSKKSPKSANVASCRKNSSGWGEKLTGLTAERMNNTSERGLSFRTGLVDHLLTLETDAQDCLKNYVLKAVVHKIDHGQDVNWLSELREVSVLFINLDPGKQIGPEEKQLLLQQSFDIVYPALNKYDASLNKVFMFDKGCTFLCVFGLPHAKHEDDTSRALKTARHIFNNLSNLELEHYSIGVTTGIAFCGVVGHPQRHEYTVIGQKVNMAARLMMNFPDAVVCDETTHNKCGLDKDEFVLEPPILLKGITNPENIYRFQTEISQILDKKHSDVHESTDADDIIGRDKEMSLFLEELQHVSEHSERDPGVMVIVGSGGIGKTKLLRAMKARAAQMDFRVVSGVGGLVERNTPFFTVKTLITRLLELDSCRNIHDREQMILDHVRDEEMRPLLPLLNDLLVLKFPQSNVTQVMHHDDRTAALHKLLYSIVHEQALFKPCVFGIDDAHWVDPDSWCFLLDLALDPNAILVMTTRPIENSQQNNAMTEILDHPHTKILELEGLEVADMLTFACKMLNVKTLPEPLKRIIRQRSHGIPLWCVELVETMMELEYLKVVEEEETIIEDVEEEDEGKDESEETFITCMEPQKSSLPVPMYTEDTTRTRKAVMQATRTRRSVCELNGAVEVGDIPIPDSVAGMVLTRIDHMSFTEQTVLKCASILGTSFTRTMLEAIIPSYSTHTYHSTLNSLAEAGIIECAVAAEAKNMLADLHTRSTYHMPLDDPHLQCPCLSKQLDKSQAPSHLPSTSGVHAQHHSHVDECEMLQFVHMYVQETVNGLWTESQRKALHESAALYLESQAHKCTNCGGGGFLTGRELTKKRNPLNQRARRNSSLPNRDAFSGSTHSKMRRMSVGIRRGSVTPASASRRSTTRRSSAPPSIVSHTDQLLIQSALQTPAPPVETPASGVRYNNIGEAQVFGINLENCYCDEILSHVYPQLVRHWRAARNMEKASLYLIESASAAVATSNNMEALSLLDEVEFILDDHGRNLIPITEIVKMESLKGQALLQSGEVEECIPHFKLGLSLLHTVLPTRKVGILLTLTKQSFKQWLHVRFPSRFFGRGRNPHLLNKARCMGQLAHAYHLQHDRMRTLMVVLKQLNAVEEAPEDIHELIEAYTVIIECCQLFDFKHLSNFYTERALSRCIDINFGIEDLSTYVHLLNVAMNTKLFLGKMSEALELGLAAKRISSQIHGISMEMVSLPLLFYVQIYCLKVEECKATLKELDEIASTADDLRAQAVSNSCHFDAILDIGVGKEQLDEVSQAARLCCEEDIYHFDDIERFFLVSCLAVWHARAGDIKLAEKYLLIASDLQNIKYETFLSLRGMARFTECHLLLWRLTSDKETASVKCLQALKKFKQLSKTYPVLKPRYLHFKAYRMHLDQRERLSRKHLTAAIRTACVCGLSYEAEWAAVSRNSWFTSSIHSEQSNCTVAPFYAFE